MLLLDWDWLHVDGARVVHLHTNRHVRISPALFALRGQILRRLLALRGQTLRRLVLRGQTLRRLLALRRHFRSLRRPVILWWQDTSCYSAHHHAEYPHPSLDTQLTLDTIPMMRYPSCHTPHLGTMLVSIMPHPSCSPAYPLLGCHTPHLGTMPMIFPSLSYWYPSCHTPYLPIPY